MIRVRFKNEDLDIFNEDEINFEEGDTLEDNLTDGDDFEPIYWDIKSLKKIRSKLIKKFESDKNREVKKDKLYIMINDMEIDINSPKSIEILDKIINDMEGL